MRMRDRFCELSVRDGRHELGRRGHQNTAASPTATTRNRWRACGYICAALTVGVLALEATGFHRQDRTMQVVLVGGAMLVALVALRWAAGALHRILLLYASCLVALA